MKKHLLDVHRLTAENFPGLSKRSRRKKRDILGYRSEQAIRSEPSSPALDVVSEQTAFGTASRKFG